jgi:uncharacterized integral membrane protein
MRFRRKRTAEEPRGDAFGLFAKLLLLVAIVAYATAFVLENRKQVSLHFVFATSRVSLIWLILLSIALGLLPGVLAIELYRRRRRRH